jgi:hypothetical protein
VAEGVVVALEAVEVEEQQHGRVGGAVGGAALEIGHELAAVGQPGQRVARRRCLELAARGAHRDDGERHEHEGHHEDGQWRGADGAEEARRGARATATRTQSLALPAPVARWR